MAANRVLVQYPPLIINEIDRIAGPGKRTAFLVELAEREIKLRRQKAAIRATAGSWKSEDHPELAEGSAAYVRELRALDIRRFEDLEAQRDGR